jgi:ABC-type cobalamin/Fe3+-siderophores transport system ATPase subunit
LSSISLNVATASGNIKLEASPSKPLFILGRNGTGKSALVHSFVAQLGVRAIYLPGSRPSYFDQENLSITPFTRKQLAKNFQQWDVMPDTRWKSFSGTSRNEKAVHDLTAVEIQFKVDAANDIVRDGKDSSAVARLVAEISPLDRVNGLLKQGNLPVSVAIETAELRAVRNGSSYSIAKMSDGERIALVMIAEVVAAPIGSVFLIDEPELHLHRAIILPLISAIMRENSESTFIVCTHELELAASYMQSSIVVLRSCSWTAVNKCVWEVDTFTNPSDLPEDVRVDILGSRRKILFVEGAVSSLDGQLYALLFPNASVRSRDNYREVERAVAGLLATKELHHSEVFGMVDGDGMSQEQIATLESKNVYPLPVNSVESLYYAEEVLAAIAKRQGDTLGVEQQTLLDEANTSALAALDSDDHISHLAIRVAERQLRDSLLQRLPSRSDLLSGNSPDISVSLPSPYPAELARLRLLHASGDLSGIVSRYPVRESRILDALAKGLRFAGRADYERAVLRQLSLDDALCNALRNKLCALAPKLA